MPLLRLACAFLVVTAAGSAASGLGAGGAQNAASTLCNSPIDLSFDDKTDVRAVDDYKAAIRQLLVQKRFNDLDCIADAARSEKAKFTGGMWKVHLLYWGLDRPPGHATEEDWRSHIKTLQQWVSARPRSITARVALAQSYISYAWDARGTGYVDTVSESGWKLFHERVGKAKEILEQASHLPAKCPEWYVAMQSVALAEGWDKAKASALLEQAVSFEPDYYYYYRQHANFLKEKWYGEKDDFQRFVDQTADHIGSPKGDILYFQIAVFMLCHCSGEPEFKQMSWTRVKNGFAELEKQNGVSLTNLNVATYMAIKENEVAFANELFSRIGDNWDEGTWKTKAYFDSCKTWAANSLDGVVTVGTQYVKNFKLKFADSIQECIQAAGGDLRKFDLMVTFGEDGTIGRVYAAPPTKVGTCLYKVSGSKLWAPPYAPYGVRIEIDPATLTNVSTK